MMTVQRGKDNYELKMLLVILALLFISITMFYKIKQNDPIAQNAIIPPIKCQQLYILKSYSTAMVYQKSNTNSNDYVLKLDKFKRFVESIGYKSQYIDEDKINTIPNNSILFVPDAIAMTSVTKQNIKIFLEQGGNLFFNFTSGFSDEKGNFIGDAFIKDITKLQISRDKKFINFNDGLYLTQRLLSVLNNKSSGQLLETPIYDAIPIFTSSKDLKPDIFMTSYEQTNPPIDKAKRASISIDESGAAWHGYYGKGKWFYINLPSYIFYDSKKSHHDYMDLFNAIVNFLSENIIVDKFPYIDKENVVFVSEDTEYKFKNFKKFSDLAQKYSIPVTAFIVSSLAQHEDNIEMVKDISKNPFVEFASHSHTHKKIIDTNASYVKQETRGTKEILDQFSSVPIEGFRPPREELDDMMRKTLSESGFRYILGKTEEYLYPKYDQIQKNLLIFPRHGTDDYSYLINLDWDSKQIVDQIIKESEFVTAMDGIYTLSVHTHLFAYSSNIKIVESYFKYLNEHPDVTPMDGRSIANRVKNSKNIRVYYSKVEGSTNTIVLSIENMNDIIVNNFHCKLFKNPNLRIKSMISDQTPGSKDSSNKSEIKIVLKHLKPNSTTTVFIEFEESI
jgi:peptidoglycan/xylan/chitin deacetylase (PgdA/CDA1 family)